MSLWEEGQWRFRTDLKNQGVEEGQINDFMKKQASPRDATRICRNLQDQTVTKKESKSKVFGKDIIPQRWISTIMDNMQRFQQIGDYMVKGAPETVGMAWWAISQILTGVQNDYKLYDFFGVCLSDITEMLVTIGTCDQLYDHRQDAEQSSNIVSLLLEQIRKVYASILDFSWSVAKYQEKGGLGKAIGHAFKSVIGASNQEFQLKMDTITLGKGKLLEFTQQAYQERSLGKFGEVIDELHTMQKNQAELLNSMKPKSRFDWAMQEFEANKIKLNPLPNSRDMFAAYIRGKDTCLWLVDEATEYKEWKSSDKNGVLYVTGESGFGKSTLATAIIDNLVETYDHNLEYSVQVLSCEPERSSKTVGTTGNKRGDSASQTLDRLQNTLIYQLYEISSQMHDDPSYLEKCSSEIFPKAKSEKDKSEKTKAEKSGKDSARNQKGLDFVKVYKGLANILEKKIILVVDAVDRLVESEQEDFLKDLHKLVDNSDSHLKVVISACPTPVVSAKLDSPQSVHVSVDKRNLGDIARTIQENLKMIPNMSTTERDHAQNVITEKAGSLFRYVEIAHKFFQEPIQRPFKTWLESLPEGLNDSYRQHLQSISPNYLQLLKTTLTWLLTADTAVTVLEVLDAHSGTFLPENQPENLDDLPDRSVNEALLVEQMRKAGGPFFEVVGKENYVRLKDDASVRRFILSEEGSSSASSSLYTDDEHGVCAKCKMDLTIKRDFKVSAKESHLIMAITCLRHINSAFFQKMYVTAATDGWEDIDVPLMDEEVGSEVGDDEDKDEVPVEPDHDLDHPLIDEVPTTTSEVSKVTSALPSVATENAINHTSAPPVEQEDEKHNACESHNEGTSPLDEVKTPDTSSGLPSRTPPEDEEMPKPPDQVEAPVGETEIIDFGKGEPAAEQDKEDGKEEVPDAADKELDPKDDEESHATFSEFNSYDKPPDAKATADAADETTTSRRYEFQGWTHHLRSAEALWTDDEEISKSALWQEFFVEADKFMDITKSKILRDWQFTLGASSYLGPFHTAIIIKSRILTGRMLERGEHDINAVTREGTSALHLAAWYAGNIGMLKVLLEHGADPNWSVKGQYAINPFMIWIRNVPEAEIIKTILDKGADPVAQDYMKWQPLHWVAMYQTDPASLKLFLKPEYKVNINAKDKFGETPLHKLMQREDDIPIPLLKAFLDNGADPNAEDNDSQMPLFEVAHTGNAEVAKILLEHNANYEDIDKECISALHEATLQGHKEVAKALIEKGAKLNERSIYGRTPFFYACRGANEETAQYMLDILVEKSIPIEEILDRDNEDRTAIRECAAAGLANIAKQVFAKIPNATEIVNLKDTKQGRTPLHSAAVHGKVEMVKLLLAHGANSTLVDKAGKTPLNLAQVGWANNETWFLQETLCTLIAHDPAAATKDSELFSTAGIRGNVHIISTLLDANADPDQKDSHGWTPLLLARQHRHDEATKILQRRSAETRTRPTRFVEQQNWESKMANPVKIHEDNPRRIEYIMEPVSGERHLDTMVLSDHPAPAGYRNYYFEIRVEGVVGSLDNPILGIGFCTYPISQYHAMPGWPSSTTTRSQSWAYHGDDGKCFAWTSWSSVATMQKYGPGDIVGCGVDFKAEEIYLTLNGTKLGFVFGDVRGRVYPVVGMGQRVIVVANFGNGVLEKEEEEEEDGSRVGKEDKKVVGERKEGKEKEKDMEEGNEVGKVEAKAEGKGELEKKEVERWWEGGKFLWEPANERVFRDETF